MSKNVETEKKRCYYKLDKKEGGHEHEKIFKTTQRK